MDPKFVKEVLENQATIPKEKTYTKKDVLEDDGMLRDGVAAVLKNSSEQGHRAVVTVLVVHRDANDQVCRVEEIDLNTDEQERLRKVAVDQYKTWTCDWEFPDSGIDASNALDMITLYKTTNIVTIEPCKSRLDRPKSTVYFMKVLVHIIKTLDHTGQYIYASASIRIYSPFINPGLEDKDRKTFSLKPLLALDETKGTSLCCRRVFGNAVIACEEWSDKLSDCSFFMDMPFSDMKTRTKCETLKEVSGSITLGGPMPYWSPNDIRLITEASSGAMRKARSTWIELVAYWNSEQMAGPRIQVVKPEIRRACRTHARTGVYRN